MADLNRCISLAPRRFRLQEHRLPPWEFVLHCVCNDVDMILESPGRGTTGMANWQARYDDCECATHVFR